MEIRIPKPMLALLAAITSTYAQTLSAPATAPSGASERLDPSFAGFGIEPSNLFSFTGQSDTNELSVTLLQNLADYSGAPPHIRLGGNTGDYMVYDDGYTSYDLRRNGNNPYASDFLTFGETYFTALKRFPAGTPVTYGLNMAYQDDDYMEVIIREAQAVVDNIGDLKLYSFEVGNEPDLWGNNGFRTGTWNGQIYTEEWLSRAYAVSEQVLKPAGYPAQFFEGPATASTIGTTFTTDNLVSYGIMQGTNGSGNLLSAWNQHDYFYFVDVSPYPLTLGYLMQLSNSETQFAHWANEIRDSLATGLPYHLREMASAGPIGLPDISNTFGAALWTLNFICYVATLGVSSIQFHMTDNSYASPWMPFTRTGYQMGVRPTYYAFAAWAQLLGAGNGTSQIAPVTLPSNLPSEYPNSVRAYAAYTNSSLSSYVIINSVQANASETSKSGLTLTLRNLPAGETLYVSELIAPGADSLDGTTWNGISFEGNSNGSPSVVNSSITSVAIGDSGTASVYVRDSSAVIANVGFQLGSRAVSVDGGVTTGSQRRPSSAAATSSTATSTASTTITTSTNASASRDAPATSSSAVSSDAAMRTVDSRGAVLLVVAMTFAITAMPLFSVLLRT